MSKDDKATASWQRYFQKATTEEILEYYRSKVADGSIEAETPLNKGLITEIEARGYRLDSLPEEEKN